MKTHFEIFLFLLLFTFLFEINAQANQPRIVVIPFNHIAACGRNQIKIATERTEVTEKILKTKTQTPAAVPSSVNSVAKFLVKKTRL